MARNFTNYPTTGIRKLRCFGQDSSAFFIKHDTFISKGREESLKILRKVTGNREQVQETEPVNEDIQETKPPIEEEVREMTPEDEEIIVDGALMTAKSIKARNKALAKKNKYKQIRKIDQSDIEKDECMLDLTKASEPSGLTNKSKRSIPIVIVSDNKLKKETVPAEMQRKKHAGREKTGTTVARLPRNFLSIDQLTIIVPKSRKGFKYVEKPGLFCSVS